MQRADIIGGITTFLTMSYIIAVNPLILTAEGTGMSFTGVLTATVLVSFVATLLMGLWADLPFALAPGMGLNAFFTYSLILEKNISWQTALGIVFWSGVFFVIISATPLREKIAKSIPPHLRSALAIGIGLFLAFIGFKNASLISAHPVTLVQAMPFSKELFCAGIGLLIIIFLYRRNNPASFLFGILGTTALAFALGLGKIPSKLISAPEFVFFQVDFIGALKWGLVPSILTLMLTDLFDSLSTFLAVAEASDMKDKNGEVKNMKKALTVDAIATLLSGLFGTSSATTYIESAAGVKAGARTGNAAIVCALCFLPFLFLSPLIASIPSFATAPVLIFVGMLMFQKIKDLKFEKIEEYLPAFLILILIPLSFSITQGLVWGLLSHVVLFLIAGRKKDLKLSSYLLALVSIYVIVYG